MGVISQVEYLGYRSKGRATLVGGTIEVLEPNVTNNSNIFLTSQIDGGTLGILRISARSVGVGFTITSLSALDTSTVAWELVN